MKKNYKIIISGGGTGGHIYPAISIANAIKAEYPESEILFVGADGRMEMEKVPKAGYDIVGLPVMGLQRKISFQMVKFVVKLIKSLNKAKKVIRKFQPDLVVGVGGYASGPLLRVASKKGVPSVIQEQNSYPGITNKMLSKTVNKICVAYDGLENWFPAEKIVFTGNPVRQDILKIKNKNKEALAYFKLNPDRPVLLILGGSLGARTINQSLAKDWEKLQNAGIQLIWQTGKTGYKAARETVPENVKNVHIHEFIYKMEYAYSVADVVVSRAGASTISELCLVKKPTVFVPSPNVAEDHQTKNAMALTKINAALLVKDSEAKEKLIDTAIDLLKNDKMKLDFSTNMTKLAKPHASADIVKECFDLLEK